MKRADGIALSAALLLGAAALAPRYAPPNRPRANHRVARVEETPSASASPRSILPLDPRTPAPSPSVASREAGTDLPHSVPLAGSTARLLVEEAEGLPDDKMAEKRALLRRALDLDPGQVDALLALGEIRRDDEDYDEAIALAERCLEVDEENDDCDDVRLSAIGRSGRVDPAGTERAYARNPDDFGRVQDLAQLRIKQGRLAEARTLIEEMRAIDPESVLVPTMEGEVALTSGDPAGALQAFEAACHGGQERACIAAEQLR